MEVLLQRSFYFQLVVGRRRSAFTAPGGGLRQLKDPEPMLLRARDDSEGSGGLRSVTTRAALLRGLGGQLKPGYVLRSHAIVDENTAVESTGDVIEKLKNGFKNFKKTQYKCVPSLLSDLMSNPISHSSIVWAFIWW